ncbi:hypothetical protein [Roseicella sp. DB1501]|uniref:hypothetical protein n=1 Tax=Roseicella sp. DB1501 TaxID=2730925 RepID=UPI001490F91A|nr:hypothetical protein [Roseicella sp. DB1501]NOG73650.1 hypothetical protein [Roseicella sp. DB1501]
MVEMQREPPPSTTVDRMGRRPNWPPFPMMLEEDSGSPLGPRMRRVPHNLELLALTRIAIALGNPKAG